MLFVSSLVRSPVLFMHSPTPLHPLFFPGFAMGTHGGVAAGIFTLEALGYPRYPLSIKARELINLYW